MCTANVIWSLDYANVFKDLNLLVRLPLYSLLSLQSPIIKENLPYYSGLY
jgi:hypothetical protein